jgi:hypothetical protein
MLVSSRMRRFRGSLILYPDLITEWALLLDSFLLGLRQMERRTFVMTF